VDPISRRQFWSVIYELSAAGITCLVTTHYLEEAERCDRIGLIFGGRMIALDTPDGLKDLPQVGTLLEVECDSPGPAVEVLHETEGVRYARLHGALVHVSLAAAEGAAERAARALEGHGLRVLRAERIRPSLEDVFVSLIREAESAQPGGPA
jgi:ABC-2 type transport system ATP-binding protein